MLASRGDRGPAALKAGHFAGLVAVASLRAPRNAGEAVQVMWGGAELLRARDPAVNLMRRI